MRPFSGICSVGGDGTLHEVANGLMQRNESVTIPIRIIPAGTGNSVAQHLQFGDTMEAARRIVAGRFQPLDVVRVAMQDCVIHCVNIVGWGAVSDINVTAEKMRFMGTQGVRNNQLFLPGLCMQQLECYFASDKQLRVTISLTLDLTPAEFDRRHDEIHDLISMAIGREIEAINLRFGIGAVDITLPTNDAHQLARDTSDGSLGAFKI